MMVTVAKSLDVPIKLVFPRPSPTDSTTELPSHAMLGLGDVVLPGIMIGLALRFDLYLFYLRRQRHVPSTEKEGEINVEKPKYFSLSGRWSDHFWTHSLFGRPLFSMPSDEPEPPFTFPKTYFKASIMGYILGMLATLGVMHIWGHAQPALLYLVPGVLGSLWLTALYKGELALMWNFSEAIEEEAPDQAKQDDTRSSHQSASSGRTSFFSLSDKKAQEREARIKKTMKKHIRTESDPDADGDLKKGKSDLDRRIKELAEHRSEREVFSFSIEVPWKLKHPRSIRTRHEAASAEQASSEQNGQSGEQEQSPGKGKAHCTPPPLTEEEEREQPPEKKARVN
jgi:minor histocompatibility antigen H13